MQSLLSGKIKLVALSGLGGCGKDSLADALCEKHGYRKYSFAEPIYNMLKSLPYLEHLHSQMDRATKETDNGFYGKSPRNLLRTLGTEWGRTHINPDVWIWIMQDKLEKKFDILRHGAFVITDLRFDNEARWVRQMGGQVVRIARMEGVIAPEHVSDMGFVASSTDHLVINNGTLEELKAKAKEIDDLAENARLSIRS